MLQISNDKYPCTRTHFVRSVQGTANNKNNIKKQKNEKSNNKTKTTRKEDN